MNPSLRSPSNIGMRIIHCGEYVYSFSDQYKSESPLKLYN